MSSLYPPHSHNYSGFCTGRTTSGGRRHIYWGGQQRRIPAIEGKTPGSKPRDLSMSWALGLLPLASSRDTSASPLATRQNSPGIWTRRCYPKEGKKTQYLHYYAHPFSFQPPSTTLLYRSRVPTMETRHLRVDKNLSHQQCRPCAHVSDESTRARSRGGDICVEEYVSI